MRLKAGSSPFFTLTAVVLADRAAAVAARELADMVCGVIAKYRENKPIGLDLFATISNKRRTFRSWPQ